MNAFKLSLSKNYKKNITSKNRLTLSFVFELLQRYFMIGFGVIFVASFLVLIIYIIIYGNQGFHVKGFSIIKNVWDPTNGKYGIGGFFLVTLLIIFFSLLFSLFLAVNYSIFLYLFVQMNNILYKFLTNISVFLSSVPTAIYGLFGFFVLHAWLHMQFSILTISIIMVFIIFPNIILFINLSFRQINYSNIAYSMALGSTKLEAFYKLAKKELVSGIILGTTAAITRILSETIAVSMLIGGNPKFSGKLTEPARNLTALISLEFTEASGPWQRTLFSVGLIILLFILVFNVCLNIMIKLTINKKE